MEFEIDSIQDLNNLTKDLLDKWYQKFLLKWELWVWKTEFTKQLAKNLWIPNITSPTYTYINNYQNKLLHWDFYRIKSEQEFLTLWILDEIENFKYICIEWPKFLDLYAGNSWLEIEIKKINQNKRKIFIKRYWEKSDFRKV